VSRFPTRNHFTSYTGTAPVAVSSGDHIRHRLNRADNRRLNHAINIAAIAQIRFDTPGRAYYRRKLAEGKSKREALRSLNVASATPSGDNSSSTAKPISTKTTPGRVGPLLEATPRATGRPTPSAATANQKPKPVTA
jgi:hypothetical protein